MLGAQVILEANADEELRMNAEIVCQELKARGIAASYTADAATPVAIKLTSAALNAGLVEVIDRISGKSQNIELESASDLVYNLLSKS